MAEAHGSTAPEHYRASREVVGGGPLREWASLDRHPIGLAHWRAPSVVLVEQVNIRQLRYALAAAGHGSFYRAARALDVEQYTLSRNILRLERVIGAKLFSRSRERWTPTVVDD